MARWPGSGRPGTSLAVSRAAIAGQGGRWWSGRGAAGHHGSPSLGSLCGEPGRQSCFRGSGLGTGRARPEALILRCSRDTQLREDRGFCRKLPRAGRPGRPRKRGTRGWGKAAGGSRWHPESRLRQAQGSVASPLSGPGVWWGGCAAGPPPPQPGAARSAPSEPGSRLCFSRATRQSKSPGTWKPASVPCTTELTMALSDGPVNGSARAHGHRAHGHGAASSGLRPSCGPHLPINSTLAR